MCPHLAQFSPRCSVCEGPWEKHRGEGNHGIKPEEKKRVKVMGFPTFLLGKLPSGGSREGEFDSHVTSPSDSPRVVGLTAKPSGRETASNIFKIHLSSLLVPPFFTRFYAPTSGTLSPRILAGQIWFHPTLPVPATEPYQSFLLFFSFSRNPSPSAL